MNQNVGNTSHHKSAIKRLSWISNAVLIVSALVSMQTFAGDHKFDQPRGFNQYLSTVVSIQNHGRDDDLVMMRGRLTNYLCKDRYEFMDDAGNSIEVELDDDVDWSYVHKDQLILIMGEVDKNMFRVRVDAKDYRIVEEVGTKPTLKTIKSDSEEKPLDPDATSAMVK